MMDKSGGKKTDGDPDAPTSPPTKMLKPSTENLGDRDEERIWMDPDALSVDCGICFMPFEAEVFMCSNGHAACARCCLRINRKCWCCGAPIGDIRCRPAERMLAEMNTCCKYSKYGCTEVLKFIDKRRHEETCPRAPIGCPVAGCSHYHGAMLLHKHLLDDHADLVDKVANLGVKMNVALHKSTPFRALVLERTGSVFLLLNGGSVLAGRSLSLVFLGPHRPEGDDGIETKYKMEVRGGEPGVLWLTGTAPCVRQLEGFEPKKFLFVPNADWGASGRVFVSIRIG